jgi:hypothetical protein
MNSAPTLFFAAANGGQPLGWKSSGAAPKSLSPVPGTSIGLSLSTTERSGVSATTLLPNAASSTKHPQSSECTREFPIAV